LRYLTLTVLILATWFVCLVAEATAIALRARLAGREPGGISLLWYIVVVPIVSGALVTGAYFLDRARNNLGTASVGSGASLLLTLAAVRAVVARRTLNSLENPS